MPMLIGSAVQRDLKEAISTEPRPESKNARWERNLTSDLVAEGARLVLVEHDVSGQQIMGNCFLACTSATATVANVHRSPA